MTEHRTQTTDDRLPAYRKLFLIADGALRTASNIAQSKLAYTDRFLMPSQLDIVALDYAIAALEAYVNYLGYIFVDGWAVLQKKHFWGQYEQVRDSLAKLDIEWPEEPLPHYRVLRDKRNHLHHAHSAFAKHHQTERTEIKHSDAKQVVEGVATFMQDTHGRLKQALNNYSSFEAIWLKIAEDNQLKQRKALYEDFIKHGIA